MYNVYSEDALRIIQEAEKVGNELECDYVCTGHILLGIMRTAESAAAKLLAGLGVDAAAVEPLLVHLHMGVRPVPIEGYPMPLMPRAKQALEVALSDCIAQGLRAVDSAQLLLGILKDPNNEASRALESLGVTYQTVREEYEQPKVLETPDGRVRIIMRGNKVRITINANASVEVDGYAFGSERYVLEARHEHVIVIEPTD